MEVLDTTIANVALRHIAGSLGGEPGREHLDPDQLSGVKRDRPADQRLARQRCRPQALLHDLRRAVHRSAPCCARSSTSLGMILVARVLQGIGGGGMAPTEQSMFADTFPPEKRAQAFALYGLTVVSAPAIGPVAGRLADRQLLLALGVPDQPAGRAAVADAGGLAGHRTRRLLERRPARAARRSGFKVDYPGLRRWWCSASARCRSCSTATSAMTASPRHSSAVARG